MGDAIISKHLDIFFLHNSLLESLYIIHAWVEPSRVSKSFPCPFGGCCGSYKPCAPFKYNPTWNEEEDFKNLVYDTWKHFVSDLEDSSYVELSRSLKLVKERVIP